MRDELRVERSFTEHLSFDVRPELRPQIADQTEPEPDGALNKSESRRIQPIRIPQIGQECRPIGTTDAPRRQRLAARVGAREDGSPECVSGPPPEPRSERSIVTRILMKRRIQTESESAVYPPRAGGGGDTLAVGCAALSPFFGSAESLKRSGVGGEAHDGQRAERALDLAQRGHERAAGRAPLLGGEHG